MAECLVPKQVDANLINTIYTANHNVAEEVKALIQNAKISVSPEPYMFFQPLKTIPISPKLYLVDGDMFFSQMQTLTISVNIVGVMGKGLALRTKYQFPDVYVYYQDVCRDKKLKMGKPYIYKRESFIDKELADDPYTLANPNSNKWFWLFPTKNHWREKSDKAGIEKGLEWIRASYKKENITSLALPALGCGLGALRWEDIGPMMCHYLYDLDIEVRIYLPREQKIREDLLSKDFWLKMPYRAT
jgi:O-acetyl-ADP-ribose deacetylase (regulator of RNase III)